MARAPLAVTQRAVLSELRELLSHCLVFDRGGGLCRRSRIAAHAPSALADGSALHALSPEGWLTGHSVQEAWT